MVRQASSTFSAHRDVVCQASFQILLYNIRMKCTCILL
jgi:hypothetical protein